jgi:hypothetical protein
MSPQAVKFAPGSDTLLHILAIPFGGLEELGGRDLDDEYFSVKTDLCADWFPVQRPLLYSHGLHPDTDVAPVGKVDSSTATVDDVGVWVDAELDKQAAYYEHIRRMVEQKKLYASSGAMPHLVRKAKDGHIDRWPWVELSLTPTPSNPLARVEAKTAVKHYTEAGMTPPPTIDPNDSRSWAELLETLADDVDEFSAGTRRYSAMRAKVGRALNETRRQRLAVLMERMRESASEIEAMLAETERRAADDAAESASDAPVPDVTPEEKAVPAAPVSALTSEPTPTPSVADEGAAELTAIFAKFQQDDAFYSAVLSTSHRR